MQSCLHMSPERGFEAAKALLQDHFGNKTKITAAYIEKVLNWPVVKAENVSLLQDYALFLHGCNNAMSDLQDMRELDMSANLNVVISKLPYKLNKQFRSLACDVREKQKRKPNFSDVVQFVEHQVKILSDPVFGDLPTTERGIHIKKDVDTENPKRKCDNITKMSKLRYEEKKVTKQSCIQSSIIFLFCLQGHFLDECHQFAKNSHREKINFLKEKGVCFGCLNTGHLSKNC